MVDFRQYLKTDPVDTVMDQLIIPEMLGRLEKPELIEICMTLRRMTKLARAQRDEIVSIITDTMQTVAADRKAKTDGQ